MMPLESIQNTLGAFLVFMTSVALAGCQMGELIETIRLKLSRRAVCLTGAHFLGGFALMFLLLQALRVLDQDRAGLAAGFYPMESAVLGMPWAVFAGAEILSILLLSACFRRIQRHRQTRLSPDSVREAVEKLPAGICVSDEDGVILLSNPRMHALCRSLTGRALTNGRTFQERIGQMGTDQGGKRLVLAPDGAAWMFERTELTLDGQAVDQLIATEMTERYRVTELLRGRNQALREVHYRMKAVAARETALVADRENMQARITVHNQMGNVLLTGRYYLEHPENMDEREMKSLLEFSSRFLMREAEEPPAEEQPVEEAIRMARRIGVATEMTGGMPAGETARRLLGEAIEQCAANTARHAGGDRIFVSLSADSQAARMEITNNGEAPKGPIAETGGLASLRRMTETAGGTMRVESEPAFRLILTVTEKTSAG